MYTPEVYMEVYMSVATTALILNLYLSFLGDS